ncbi:MAG: HalX domain-containing protein [Salinirussus sp.]
MSNRKTEGTATVLVVDDERDVADLYAVWLSTEYDVRTAYGGQDAIEAIEDAVDVVLLDRQMPDRSGDDVLSWIARGDSDPRVVMVTAVDPDFDVVDMPFDEYLTKPVEQEELVDVVDRMLERDRYDETMREYFALASKKATLEAEKPPAELGKDERYRRVVHAVEELGSRADATVDQLDTGVERLFEF